METNGTEHIQGKVALLVEDNPIVLTVAREMIQMLGLEVFAAQNGLEGLRIFKQRPEAIDVVISDVVMPIMGGTEMVREIREIRNDIPVIFCSGYVGGQFCCDESCCVLHKPYRVTTLRQVLVDVLGPPDIIPS